MMGRPNADRHIPSAGHLLGLFAELRKLGRSKMDVCMRIGVPYRTMSDYTNPLCRTETPYTVQFAIECELAWERENHPDSNFNKTVAKSGYRPYNDV